MTPQISVLLPYRDASETLDEALDSVLAQDQVDLEVIAVDDGSRDDGPARVARLAGRHGRLVAVSAGGVGIARALAIGLAEARAPLIARMDSDDLCLPGRFARQVDLLRAQPRVAVVGTQVEPFPSEAVGEGLRRYVAWQNALVTPEDHARQLFVESPLCHPSVMIRREVLAQVGGWRDVGWPEDYDLWLRIDAAGGQLAKVPQVLLQWRHRVGRATFADDRYHLEQFRRAKAPHLARRVLADGRPLAVWGAGRTGKRLARLLEIYGVRADHFIDIDPKKIGSVARGAPIVGPARLPIGTHLVVVAAGAIGARDLIRASLDHAGFREGYDYLCAA
jgi:glycosyltransferase involved in cell wall biosynthesis